jgi:TrmH family RNA methyltransferase
MSRRDQGRTPIVESPQNATVRLARRLERDRGERSRRGLYIAWGLHLAQEATRQRGTIERTLLGPAAEATSEGLELTRELERQEVPVMRTTARVLEGIAPGSADQGVLLIARRPEIRLDRLLAGHPSLLLLAHGVQDPGNVGSMVRSALALEASALIALEGTADPFGSRAARAAMGALFRLPVLDGITRSILPLIRSSGLRLVAADARDGEAPSIVDLAGPVAFIVGSEGGGLPEEILSAADGRVRIPMAHGGMSLNVHAAATILLYEAMRQRGARAPRGAP